MSAPAAAKPAAVLTALRRSLAVFFLPLILAVAAVSIAANPVASQEGGDGGSAANGALMMTDGRSEAYVEAVRLGTDVSITVTGQVQRATVTQAFRNTSDRWMEATYLYPLPENGAVDSMMMVVGNRIITGRIQPREEARRTYETARAEGRRAGLVEQQRPNMFSTAVANIGPGETVLVRIEYQAPVRQVGGEYSLRVPLVVGPRYSPDVRADGSDPVPNRAGVTQPILVGGRPINPVSISIRLSPGFPVGDVASPYHRVTVSTDGQDGRLVALDGRTVPADRDFVLNWRAAPGSAVPTARLFRERVGDADYVMAVVTPPTAPRASRPTPREVVFVIDNSGSMGGESMRQAKASLIFGLSRLRPGDRFNVVRFDDTMETLFEDTVPADQANLDRARAFVNGLEASGGTEMLPALRRALVDPRPNDRAHLRQVIFLTDGAVSNEQEMFAEVGANAGRSRVFTVGIGSAPNTFLMTRFAEMGRGTFTHIGSTDEVEARMRELFNRLETPVATGLSAGFSREGADVAPGSLPDLYQGEPVVLVARVLDLEGQLVLTGQYDGRPWRVELPLSRATEGRGVGRLWARRKIADAEVAMALNQVSAEAGAARILALAMNHHLVSSQTSLVAVDTTPARPANAPLRAEDLPINLPAGWDFNTLFGGEHRARPGGSGSRGETLAALELPQTATPAELALIAGLALMLAGGGLLVWRRRVA